METEACLCLNTEMFPSPALTYARHGKGVPHFLAALFAEKARGEV